MHKPRFVENLPPPSGKKSPGGSCPGSAQGILALFGRWLSGLSGVELEYSLRLQHGGIVPCGRFSCWLPGRSHAAMAPVAAILAELGAPEEVRQAQMDPGFPPLRHGLGAALDDGGHGWEFRFYRHSRGPHGQKDRHHAWRWRVGAPETGKVRTSFYDFWFLPETPAGIRPESLVSAAMQPALRLLLEEEHLRRLSGFWLREDDGACTQLDIALPWRPHARSLPGVEALTGLFKIGREEADAWLDLHLKHIAFRVGGAEQSVTLYVSAAAGQWPVDEAALQAQVRRGSRQVCQATDSALTRFPARKPRVSAEAGAVDLDAFYGGPVPQWRAVLGRDLHYHAGLFDNADMDPDDGQAEEALRRAVRELYPLLPAEGRIYDVGCGWGGPLAMLAQELGLPVLGLTISRTQFRHVAGLQLPVRLGDAESTLPPGAFSAAFLLESLCHVEDKSSVLQVLRLACGRLVMRVNCQDAAPAGTAFGGSMHMVSSSRLREVVEGAGWRIRHWQDRRPQALPSVRFWHRRLEALGPTDDAHIEVLRTWCRRVLQMPGEWCRNNPLIEVMAE